MGRRRAIELDWKPARLTPTKEPDPTLEAYKKHSKKELGYLLSTWRSERQLSLRQAAKETMGTDRAAVTQMTQMTENRGGEGHRLAIVKTFIASPDRE